jgi:lactate dehydrogenase-like 2-hydroxyacid dehydrogenase
MAGSHEVSEPFGQGLGSADQHAGDAGNVAVNQHGLAALPNIVLLPHVGSATVPVRNEMARMSALNAVAIAEGRVPPHAVNKLVGA